ncbi:hypothetical protein GIB67_021136, partial [Kingdonia uniflora]
GETDGPMELIKPRKAGGPKATAFIYIMMGLDNIGFVANMASMVLYIMLIIKFDVPGAATATINYLGTAFMLTLLGGFISDTYMNRLNTCLVFGAFELMGYILIVIQAHSEKLHPKPCSESRCVKGGQAVMFYASFYFLAIGAGGIRGSVPALGADQFDPKDGKEQKQLASFFNWFLLSITVGAVIGVTFIVYITLKRDGIKDSSYHWLLDKSAIVHEGLKPEKWRVCTVTQVEEVKIITRMMPIFLSVIIMNTCFAQLQTLSVQQEVLMNPRIGSFNVPADSIPVIPLFFVCCSNTCLRNQLCSSLSKDHWPSKWHNSSSESGGWASSIWYINGYRRNHRSERRDEFVNDGHKISLFWLAIHYGVFGIADMFTLVGLMEFFYTEAPVTLKSLSTSFSWLSLSIGYFLSSVFVDLINSISSKLTKNKMGWLEGRDMNTNHVDLFYWFLAMLSVLNFANCLYWANWYK